MKWRDSRVVLARARILVTRKTQWVRQDGSVEVVKESLGSAWAIVGIHSYNWWWVRRWGELPCGCTRNPITRRMVLYAWRCPIHVSLL